MIDGILGRIEITLILPVWQPWRLRDPLDILADLLKDHADRLKKPKPPTQAGKPQKPDIAKCIEIVATEIIIGELRKIRKTRRLVPDGNPRSWREARKGETPLPVPGNGAVRQAPPPPKPLDLEIESLALIPASLPVHGAPYLGGMGSPVTVSAVQYDSAERSLTASGLDPPDIHLPGIEKHALTAITDRPLNGWAATPQTDQPKTSTGKPPGTAALVSITDRFYVDQPQPGDATWHYPLVDEARRTYLYDSALDSYALQQSSRNNSAPKELERKEIYKRMEKCVDILCDFRHIFLLQKHLAELETETARLRMGLTNLETAERLVSSPLVLP